MGYRVTLADLSPDLLALARQKAAESAVKFEEVVEANAVDRTEFSDASFDAVLCMAPMCHLIHESDRGRAVSEVIPLQYSFLV